MLLPRLGVQVVNHLAWLGKVRARLAQGGDDLFNWIGCPGTAAAEQWP